MKRILSILLVAFLATTGLFAAFSGSATLGLGYNFENDKFGFSNANKFDLDFELATDEKENVTEGDIYASIKANFSVRLVDGDDKTSSFSSGMKLSNNLFAVIKLTEAKIAGSNWYLSIKESSSNLDLAKSAIDKRTIKKDKDDYGFVRDDYSEAVTYKANYTKAPGFEAGFANFVFGAGLTGVKGKDYGYNIFLATPDFDFDVVTVKLAASLSDKYDEKALEADNMINAGVSAKLGFDTDIISGYVASDVGFESLGKEGWKASEDIKADVAANLSVSPVTLDFYYATNVKTGENKEKKEVSYTKNLLSAQAKVDLNDFQIPLSLTVVGKDLINKQDLSLKAEFAITEELSLDAKVGYIFDTAKLYTEGNVKYAADLFTVKSGIKYSTIFEKDVKDNVLSATASIESSSLIPGATLKLEYASADKTMNFLNAQKTSQNFGKINASMKIAF